ncbi:MAG: hypothetical protein OXP71_03940 [Candidatus Poribacteria bacterium]|nr:hypothetical protein [Candidatus Poribacteria bacterium]
MKCVFVVLLALLCARVCWGERQPYSFTGLTPEEIAWHGALDMADKSDFIAVGTVVLMSAKYYENILPHNTDFVMTDVLVKISDLIKGKPNVGKDHIKFAIHGGSAYVPSLGRVLTQALLQEVKFAVGEKVLLFLANNTNEGESYYANYPHGRHRVHMMTFGKRLVKDGKVSFNYNKDAVAKPVQMPLELATSLLKSYLKDANATLPLENEIKTLVRESDGKAIVSKKLADELKKKSDKIIRKEKK